MLSRTVLISSVAKHDALILYQQSPLLFNKAISTSVPNPFSKSTTHNGNETISYSSHGEQQTLFYTYIFSRLKSPPHLLEAKRLHALLVVNGFFNPSSPDRVLGSQLVNIYVNFGCLREALLVFDKLPNRSNNFAWNSILRGLIAAGQFPNAIEFYYSMLRQGLVPDNFTYPLALKACSGMNDLEQGRSIRNQILFGQRVHNSKGNIYVECAMIDMFAKCGSLKEAGEVFENMLERDLASWTAMISGAVHNGEWFQALSLFKRMRLEGLKPDSVILATVLPSCGRLECKQMGKVMHGCAIRSGLDIDLFVSNALIDMYCKCSDTYEARRIFLEIWLKDTVSWSTLIAGLSQNCQYQESFGSYIEMKNVGIRTNAIIAASVLPAIGRLKQLKQGKEMHGYIIRQAFESDVVVGSALIDMYANCGSIRKAKHIFEIMLNRGISIWNSMIVGCSQNEDVDLAFATFRRMWDYNLRPNSITLLSAVPMCTKMGSLRLGREIHGYVMRNHFCLVISVGNSIIDMYSKCGYLQYGVKMFSQMMEKNIVTYNTIIAAHGRHGRGNEAFTLYEQMKEEGIRPNKVTFVGLLSACSHLGLLDRGWFFFNSMKNDHRIQPDMEHYACMVDLLGRTGHINDAFNFIRSMHVEPNLDIWGGLLGACRVYNEVELAEVVGEQILQKNQKDSGQYVLLSNIYASTDRWNEALKIRKMIKETGLIKKAGSSWIQIGSSFHMFYAGDKMHPGFSEIQELLESLLLEIKDEGYAQETFGLS